MQQSLNDLPFTASISGLLRQGSALFQLVDIAADAIVTARKTVVADQILMDPFGDRSCSSLATMLSWKGRHRLGAPRMQDGLHAL